MAKKNKVRKSKNKQKTDLYRASSSKSTSKKIKILGYMDSPTCATGFGTVSRNIFEGLYRTGRYDIDILGINYWGDPHEFPYRIWPTGTNQQKDPYGRQKVLNMIPQMDFDILFMLQDSFILSFVPPLIQYLKANRSKSFKSIIYYPVDSIIKQEWANNIAPADYLVAYSEYGKKETLKRIDRPDIRVIPHGVNTSEYYPLPKEEVESFKRQFFGALADKFIITNVNRNQQRKDIPRTIRVFKEFRKIVPNSILYLHMAIKDQGWNLEEVCKTYELDMTKDVIFPKNFGPNQGYPRHVLNLLYNCSDVVVSTTLGEGFGLCLHPETNVYTDTGIKMMKDLTIDDKVLSSDGSYNDIKAIMSRDFEGELYNITTWLSNIPLKTSPDHGFYVYENNDYTWKKASDLKVGDILLFPKNYSFKSNLSINILDIIYDNLNSAQRKNIVINGDKFKIQSNFKENKELFIKLNLELTPDVFRLFGLYLAEGSIGTKKDSVAFSFNINETDVIEFVKNKMNEIFGLDYYIQPDSRENYNGITLRFYSSVVAQLFYVLCGKGARTKKIHPILLNADKINLIELLYGLYIGDGSYSSTTYEVVFSTTSKNIAYMIRLLLARLNILSSVRTSRVEYKVSISGKSSENLRSLFGLPLENIDRSKASEKAFILPNYLALPIKNIEKEFYCGKLIDIQVDSINNFVAENVIVHNSWLEALATKTPIIMPANTMLPEFITDEIGWLCRSGSNPSLWTTIQFDNEVSRPLTDVEHMVELLLDIYNNPNEAKRRAENGYRWVTTKMDWQRNIVPMWIKLFDEAVESLKNSEISSNITENDGNRLIETEEF